MTIKRKDFLAFLQRCKSAGLITKKEAEDLLAAFDAGRISEADFPLTDSEAIESITQADVERALKYLRKEGLQLR